MTTNTVPAVDLWHHAGRLRDAQQFSEARDAYLLLASTLPHGSLLWFNVGRCSEILGDYEWGRYAFRQAIDAERFRPGQPDPARAFFGLGACLFRLGEPGLGEAFWREGLAERCETTGGVFERSQVNLCLGDYAGGWQDYESRRKLVGYSGSITSRIGTQALPPEWDGVSRGKVLVVGGMGAGDVIQFSRYLPFVEQVSEEKPVLASGGPLQRFLGYDGRTNGCDWWCPLDSLPLLLRRPEPVPPYCPPPWRRPLGNHKPRVGICWKGSSSHTNDKDRSSPFDPRPMLMDERWRLVSLQDGENFSPTDYQDTADLMNTLDAVVTVDTSVAHLAGTLGVPTIVIPPTCPEYRWQLRGEASPWYPSITLVRRRDTTDWQGAWGRAKTLLAEQVTR